MAIRRQELYCHACGVYVQFAIDDELEGQHTLECPNCGHEHYRYVVNGRITDRRWRSSGPVYGMSARISVNPQPSYQLTYQVPQSTVTYTTTSTSNDGWISYGSSSASYS